MDHSWSEAARQSFQEAPHRFRYLACDALVNPPAAGASLYAVQYSTSHVYPIYKTSMPSAIVLSSASGFYAFTTDEAKNKTGMWPSNKRSPKGPAPHQRLDTASMWSRLDASEGDTFAEFKTFDVEALYEDIVAICDPARMLPTFTGVEFHSTVPRPSEPVAGIVLGTPFAQSDLENRASPSMATSSPSRRGGRHGKRGA
jgi:hypothetical protein